MDDEVECKIRQRPTWCLMNCPTTITRGSCVFADIPQNFLQNWHHHIVQRPQLAPTRSHPHLRNLLWCVLSLEQVQHLRVRFLHDKLYGWVRHMHCAIYASRRGVVCHPHYSGSCLLGPYLFPNKPYIIMWCPSIPQWKNTYICSYHNPVSTTSKDHPGATTLWSSNRPQAALVRHPLDCIYSTHPHHTVPADLT